MNDIQNKHNYELKKAQEFLKQTFYNLRTPKADLSSSKFIVSKPFPKDK